VSTETCSIDPKNVLDFSMQYRGSFCSRNAFCLEDGSEGPACNYLSTGLETASIAVLIQFVVTITVPDSAPIGAPKVQIAFMSI
jgi:hypothetical protein